MVLNYISMEEDEDLEALRLAALQTIRPRKEVRKIIASVTAHRQLEKPFCRHITNPNLIAIVPTETEIELQSPQQQQQNLEIPDRVKEIVKKKSNEKKAQDEKLQEKERTREHQFIGIQQKDESKDINSEKNLSKEDKNDISCSSNSKNENHNFDEDELDFESDTVMLHDDDDSLDRLMDEMEQEFSQGVSTNNNGSTKVKKVKGKKGCKKLEKKGNNTSCPDTADTDKNKTTLTTNIDDKRHHLESPRESNNTALKSPSRHHSPKGVSSSSPSHIGTSPPQIKKRYSPSSPPRRRSPISPRIKRRRSITPPRRNSRSPPNNRANITSKYNRARSPYPNKYNNGRRSSDSPHKRNSSCSPCRKCSNRKIVSPQRRKSPPPVKGRSISPVSSRHRRSPSKRSPNSVTMGYQNQPTDSKHRWRSPHSRKLVSQHKRDLSSRISKNMRRSSPNQKMFEETKQDKIEKKSFINKISENIDKKRKEDDIKVEEQLDPKFEARRRKFESVGFITSVNKKICLKSSNDNQSKFINNNINIDRKIKTANRGNEAIRLPLTKEESDNDEVEEEVEEEVVQEEEEEEGNNDVIDCYDYGVGDEVDDDDDDNKLPISSTRSKVVLISTSNKKSPFKPSNRKVTEILQREASPEQCLLNKIVMSSDEDEPQTVTVNLSSLSESPERRIKSKVNNKIMKQSFDDKHKGIKNAIVNDSVITVRNDFDEYGIKRKKVGKKKKKNRRRREVIINDNSVEEDEGEDHELVLDIDGDEEKEDLVSPPKQNIVSDKQQEIDLRAELSRRRAERLKGVTNPMARIIQSAFEDVVANRKKFDSRDAVDKTVNHTSNTGLPYKSKGSRRVHVLEESKTSTSRFKGMDCSNELDSDNDGFSDDNNSIKFPRNTSDLRSSTIRRTTAENNRNFLRRSQVTQHPFQKYGHVLLQSLASLNKFSFRLFSLFDHLYFNNIIFPT